jgi:hypothetical protein
MHALLLYVFACEILIRGTEWLIAQNITDTKTHDIANGSIVPLYRDPVLD